MLLLRGRALLLNAALGIGIGLLVSWGVKNATEIANRVDNAASKAKEASDAAANTTSSLKELTDAYEELGDKSKWDTDDFDQAKDIQAEILDLAKEQGTLDEDKLRSLNLQNGKYQEQLELLKQIKEEQIRAATDDYEKDADKQGKKLVKDAKDSTGWGPIGEGVTAVTSIADHKMAEDLQAHGFNIFKDIAPLGVTLGPTNINDANSIVEYYNQINKALKYLEKNYKEADLESKGVYEGLYNILSSQKDALDDQVSAYQDASDTLKENLEEVGKYDLSNYLAGGKKVSLSHDEIDAKVRATQEYKDAVDAAKKTEAEWAAQGESQYGNIDNFDRDKIDWTVANRKKYSQFVAENPYDTEPGNYSTVIGQWDYLSKYADVANEDQAFTFSPMLQTDDGLVPLTNNQLTAYLHNIVQQATDKNGKVDISKLMELDATGLEQNINGAMMRVKGMIAGVEGGKDTKGRTLTRADILAISGDSNEEIVKDYYGKDADKYYGLGNLSRYVGKSMHDAQKAAQEGKDNIEAVYNQIYDDIENQNGQRAGDDPAAFRYFDHIQSAFDTLAQSLGKDKDEMKISDILGLTADGVELTDEQAQAIETLSAAASRYGTTIEGVAQAGEENGMFGGIEDAQNRIVQTAKDMETLSQQIDNIQKAYKSCSTAVDEYNKYGYMSADALQSLLSMDYEYLNCMEIVNGKLVLNNDAFAQMVASKYADAKVTAIQNAIAQIQAITQDSVKESTDGATEAMDDEVNKLNELSPGLGDAIKGTVGLATAQDLLNAVAEKQPVNPDRVQTILNGLNTQLSVIDSTIDTILSGSSKIKTHLNGFNKNNKSKSKSASKSVTDVASAFDTLTKAMKEYNQYGYISADTMKSMMKLEDKFTSCLVKNGDKLEINANEFRKLVETQLKQEEASGKASKSADELKRILSYLDSNVHSSTISFEQLTDVIKGYGTAMADAKEKTDAIKSAFSGLYDVQQKTKNSQFGVGDLDATESKIESILQLSKFFGDNKDLMDNLVDKNGNINLNTEAFKKATLDELDKRIEAANRTGGAAATALANSLSSDKANIESGKISVSDYLVGLGTDLKRVNTELDKYQANWNTLKDAMDEWNTTGQLTQDTMQKLQELPEEFSNLLTYDEDGNAKIDVKALRQSYVDKLSAFSKEFEGSPIGIQVQAMIDDVREPTHDEYVELAKKTATYQKVLAQYTKKMSAIDSNKDLSEDEALQQKAEVQKELDDALEKALLEVQETDAQVTTKLKKHWDGVEKVIEEFKSALSDAKAVLSSFLSLLSTLNDKSNNDLKIWGDAMGKVIDKRIEALNKQKEALEENNEATERAIELSKAQDALARAQQQRTTRVYTENGYEWQANAEDVRTAREDLADKQREWNKKDVEKAIDDQIKKYNEFKDKLSEVMDDIGKSWKDYQKELEYTAQIQKMSLSQMEGSLDGYHNKIIASLNTGSAITGIQNLITNLESLINTLTKLNNLYSMLKTGEYKDLGIKGLWDTIKGFFGKGKSENVNKSFKDTFDAAKKAFNAGKKQLTDTAITGTNDVINAMINQIKTSGNGLIETFGGIWNTIKTGAQSLFNGSGEGGGIISTVVNGFKTIGGVVKNSKIGSAVVSGGGKLLAGAGKLITTAGSALAAAGPAAIPIAGAAALGIYGGTKAMKNQKKIWSNKEDGFGKKAIKSVASFFWDISPIGAVVNLCKDIFGKSKETAENTKDTANSSSETAENTKKATGVTNLTINATQGTISEENKTEPVEEKKQSKWDKFWGSKFWFWNWGKKASGDKKIKHGGTYNVDEAGPEMLVRQPASGRYTYLETGDGVVPADITSRLFEMGGNPDKWFSDQLAKNGSASMVQSRSSGGISLSIGDVNVNNPVGDSDALASELVNRLPNRIVQQLNKR